MKRLVKIKTWEQMVKEFGINTWNNIDCKYGFTNKMEELMPKNRIIEIHNITWYFKDIHFDISKDMIEKELSKKDYPQHFI